LRACQRENLRGGGCGSPAALGYATIGRFAHRPGTPPGKEITVTQRILIRDVQPNQLIQGVYAIQNCQLGQTKNGKPYIKCLIADKSGRTPGRMWNASEDMFAGLPTDGFVYLEGQTQPYQGEMQIIIQHLHGVKPTEADLLELLPTTSRSVDQMFGEVVRLLGTIKDPALKALADTYLSDGDLMGKFCKAPAAMTLHHAFLGGLLEHTLNVLNLAEAVLPLYPQLSRDLMLMGLFIHDLGKCAELSWESGFGYSDDGQLVGHVARGVIWLQRKAEDCAALGHPLPTPTLMVLHHIILSHHGQLEYGALKIPATPEAIAVNMLDNFDAKLHMALTATRGEAGKAADLGGNFTEKMWAFENTRLYRPDPTKIKE
jgi:3'-5' exoribonuclease